MENRTDSSPDVAGRFKICIQPAGISFLSAPDMPVMAAARAAGVAFAASCQNGTCRTCMCRLVSGEIRYVIEWPGLSPEEKAQGWILPCVAQALSPLVIEEPRAAAAD